MTASLTIPRGDIRRLMTQLRAVKRKSARDMLTELSKTLARYLMQATPPFNAHPFGPNVWAEQKRIGVNAVKRDFRRSFTPFSPKEINRWTHNVSPHTAHWLKRYAQTGQLGKLNTMLRKLGMPETIQIIRHVTGSLAKQNVVFQVRPHKIKHKYLVIDKASIKRELDQAIEHVGRAKAGWLTAANGVGFKGAPQWVKRHEAAATGALQDRRSDALQPSVTMINSTKGAPATDKDVVATAMTQLEISMVKQMEAIQAKHHNSFNRGN